MLLNRGYIGGKVDVWSAGVVLFAMACGFLPFDEGETAVLYDKICKGVGAKFIFNFPVFFSSKNMIFFF